MMMSWCGSPGQVTTRSDWNDSDQPLFALQEVDLPWPIPNCPRSPTTTTTTSPPPHTTMAVALAEFPVPAPALANICATRPQISTRPLRPSEYYPPGTSRTSKIRTDVDADRIYNATAVQHTHILQQLEEAEKNARDALFTLEMMEMELARETSAIKSTLSYLSELLPSHEFEEMCDFAFDQSKKDWENEWKREWVEDGTEKGKFIDRPRDPPKKRRPDPSPSPPTPHVPSSPLPPSSPPPPTPPVNTQDRLPPRTSPVRINGVPLNKWKWPTRPRSPLPPDGFRAPWGFVDKFGSTRYRPTPAEPLAGPSQPQQSRRLKRDRRRVEMHQDGTLVLVDPTEDIEAQRREIMQQIRFQAQRKLPAEAEISLGKIVQTGYTDRTQDPPVTWFRVFEDEGPLSSDLTNPFAQDDHIPPTYLELHSTRSGQAESEQEPESEGNSHVQDNQQ
ncbi:hypothetical protein BDM02DRAFT_1324028 [Thelephora ganbajun]|uniref:Uncharacterized protein n=1 Tax=Thelephora ganbajun TaxID=370292 RepID=A0ACB6ZMP7_THEGA|nr:hypothetical protein BDM02DRAFT_1324028 [Thelephora ganbajun]